MTTVAHWEDREPGYVYIGRKGGGLFGNPFYGTVRKGAAVGHSTMFSGRDYAIKQFREYFYGRLFHDPDFKAAVHGLRGKQLVCHCKPLDCHGDVIAEYLNSLE